ncbi:hypothetical protein DYB30_010508 [Aphanomyces astaci]|uniref:Uncharacterized protein n=1 Tax=Aphanomyces astaci TaxID=112090 RepID=A0A397CML3_APHAT|nr:hypothetical protein DYB30_010508 [Aphanomyces astaci]
MENRQQQGASHLPHLVDAREHPQYDLGRKSPQTKQRVLGTRSNAISSAPPLPAVLTSRDMTVEARSKLRKEQQVQIKAKHKAQLEMEHQRRLEQLDRRAQKLLEQRRHLACQSQGRLWLKVVAVIVITSTWQRRLAAEKKRKSVEFRQVSAVCLIQRVWRRKVHLSNSKAMLQIILKTRQILWSLTFKLMCKNKAKAGGVLRRFLVDYFNGSSETGNFRVMMARWRWRVIHAQRASNRARMVALSLLWDNADRERQRTEKLQLQQNKTVLVTTSSGGAQAADFGADTSAQLATTRRLLRTGIQEESLDEMEQQLSVMQTMLTPIEFQRMQHHAHHVVRIPKSIKAKLLTQYLAAKRAENIQAVQQYAAHVASNTSSRQVQVSDARAIVQNGAWGTMIGGSPAELDPKSKVTYPVFTLYSKNMGGEMRKLIHEGIAMTLEQDPEQRRLVETQRQDIMAGRVGAVRAAAEALIFELGSLGSRASDDGEANATSIATSLKGKVDRVQSNLAILKKLSVEFEDKTKNIEKVTQAQRNLMFEYYWKLQVRELAGKGANVWLSQMTTWFPRMEYLSSHASALAPAGYATHPIEKVKAPMKVNDRFTPKSSKRARSIVFDEQGDLQPADLGQMMEYIMKRNKAAKFWKQTETTRGGRKVITSITCHLHNELVVHMSFCPHIPEDGPKDGDVSASPMTPSTPNSPAFGMNRGLRAKRRQASLKAKKVMRKSKRDDLLAKVKMAAEEATKIEQEELRKLILDAKESGKEQEIARAAGLQVTKFIQRISIFPLNEPAPLGAWSESKHKLFEQITLHARQTWMSYFDKVYQTPCNACKKILAKTADDSTYVPPAFRDYSTGLAYHSNCM